MATKVHDGACDSNPDAGSGRGGDLPRGSQGAGLGSLGSGGLSGLPRETTKRGRPADSYKRLRDYGIIGNLHTVALVGVDGSIDWYCYPYFDSASLFGAILDSSKGGHFRISTQRYATRNQFYLPDTNVLITRFLTREGVGEVTDYMPIAQGKGEVQRHRIIRQVEAVRGTIPFELECLPAFDYARRSHETKLDEAGAQFLAPNLTLTLAGLVPLQKAGAGVRADFRLKEGESASFVLEGTDGPCTFNQVHLRPPEVEEARILFERMLGYANSLGLYAEEIGRRGEALGNFPQAFTHLGLIAAAVNLDKALGETD